MRILKRRTHHHHVEHRLSFERVGAGGGYSFLCNEAGHLDEANLPPAARDNYRACLAGLALVRSVVESVHDYTEHAVGACEVCGREVVLYGFTNACDCGADYNASGQLLAPRECWGEETGESLADILGVDAARPVDSLE
jgi:hypothetical protein